MTMLIHPIRSINVPPLALGQSPPTSVSVRASTVHIPQKTMGPCLTVNGVQHRKIDVSALRAGDIGFQYKPHRKNLVQHLIGAAQHFFNLHCPLDRGDPHVLHTFVVLAVLPRDKVIIAADASGSHNMDSIGQAPFDFSGRYPHPRLDRDASHLFYRVDDPAVSSTIAQIATNWTTGGCRNFSNPHAVLAIFRSTNFRRPAALRRIAYAARFARYPGALPNLQGHGFYKMMCSELVANIAAATALDLFSRDHGCGSNLTEEEIVCALTRGRLGNVFAVDPVSILPATLLTRLQRLSNARAVGYIPPLQTA